MVEKKKRKTFLISRYKKKIFLFLFLPVVDCSRVEVNIKRESEKKKEKTNTKNPNSIFNIYRYKENISIFFLPVVGCSRLEVKENFAIKRTGALSLNSPLSKQIHVTFFRFT